MGAVVRGHKLRVHSPGDDPQPRPTGFRGTAWPRYGREWRAGPWGRGAQDVRGQELAGVSRDGGRFGVEEALGEVGDIRDGRREGEKD